MLALLVESHISHATDQRIVEGAILINKAEYLVVECVEKEQKLRHPISAS